MKINIEKSELVQALDMATKAASTKSTLPILEGVLFDACKNLKITGNNLEVAIQVTVESNVTHPGKIVVNGNKLANIVKSMPDNEIEITSDDKSMEIRSGKSKMEIPVLCASGFPGIDEISTDKYFEINAQKLKELISNVSFAASTDPARPALNGILLNISSNQINAVAINNSTMALRITDIKSDDCEILIMAKDLDMVSRIIKGTVKISMQKNVTCLEFDNTKVILRQIEGEFIKYKQVIPTDFSISLKIKVKELLSTIDRSLMILETNDGKVVSPVLFTIKNDTFKVSLNSIHGKVNDEIIVESNGGGVEIGFDPRRMSDCLKRIEDPEIYMKFTSEKGPCILIPINTDKFLYLILPTIFRRS